MYLHGWYSRRFLWKYKAYETRGSGCGRDREMVSLVSTTKNPDTKQGRIDLCRKHYNELLKLFCNKEKQALSVDDRIYADLKKRHSQYEDDELIEEPAENVRRQKSPGKLFEFLAFARMVAEIGGQKRVPHFRIGEHVRVRWRGQEGTIIDINGGLHMVSLDDGRAVDSFPESDLEKAW